MRNLLTPIVAFTSAIFTYALLKPRTKALPPAPPFELGSLVTVAYEEGVFYVETYTHSSRHDEDGVYREDYCDLTDATTGDSLIAFVEEMTQVATASAADEYLATIYTPVNLKEEPIMQPINSRNSATPRKQALVDRLLEQRQQYRDLAEFFGGGYDGNLALIDEDLLELARLETPAPAFLTDVEGRIQQRINHRTYDKPLEGSDSE
jgi:hypothetical protein